MRSTDKQRVDSEPLEELLRTVTERRVGWAVSHVHSILANAEDPADERSPESESEYRTVRGVDSGANNLAVTSTGRL